MINHVSVPARDPEHVANVLAELWRGVVLPFPVSPGSFVVFADDGRGTAIDVEPIAHEFVPGAGEPVEGGEGLGPFPHEVQIRSNPSPSPYTVTHVAINSPLSEEEIKAIATREGWRAVTCDRGPAFRLIEFWVENRLLVEIFTPEMTESYVEFMKPANWRALFEL
jgi:hypothetical protein